MPRAWPTECRNDRRHPGPISRRGYCLACGANAVSEGGRNGGLKMRKSWFSSPSRAPSQRRIYYAKLKLAKQQEAQRARKTKIVKKIAMKKRRVNHTKERKIKIGANRRQATPASITNQISSSSDNASARYCFRCERRMDRCREEGCHPYEFHVDKQRF